jgi:DNA-binding NarL/FixJ family response regulator
MEIYQREWTRAGNFVNSDKRPLKVLLVEDSPLLAERLREIIDHQQGIELLETVDNEITAIQVSKDAAPDALILDLHLKQGTGFGVLRSIRNDAHKPVVVVLTNYALPQYQREAKLLGARYFLDKAREFERIPEVLNEIAREGH